MNEPENLVLEHLRALRADVAKVATRLDNLTMEVRSSNAHVAAIVQSDMHQNVRIAELEARLERVEKRLEIVD
jgi:tetrahydromethanopterin S-methyltransferase subunit G